MLKTVSVLLLLLVGCQATGSGEAAGFGGTGKAEVPFEATGATVVVNVAVSLETGTATLTILDPFGLERFKATIDSASPLVQTLRLNAGRGRWLAVVTYTDAKGTRSVDWHND